MKSFLLIFLITTVCVFMIALLINFCRRRLARTPHGLSGICHQTGGEVCNTCSEKMKDENEPAEK